MEEAAKASGKPLPAFRFPRGPRTETIGPMVDEEHNMIKFVPNWPGGTTDASYHLPAFYELWARWGPEEDRAFWAKAADVSRELFNRVTGPETGLTPDRSNFDGTPVVGRNGTPVPFMADSWRSVSNWSVDYSWWRKDARETELSGRLQKFLEGEGIDRFVNQYTLDGKPLSTTTLAGHAGDGGGGQPGGAGWADGEGVCGRAMEYAGAFGRVQILRRAAVFDEHDARERGVQDYRFSFQLLASSRQLVSDCSGTCLLAAGTIFALTRSLSRRPAAMAGQPAEEAV